MWTVVEVFLFGLSRISRLHPTDRRIKNASYPNPPPHIALATAIPRSPAHNRSPQHERNPPLRCRRRRRRRRPGRPRPYQHARSARRQGHPARARRRADRLPARGRHGRRVPAHAAGHRHGRGGAAASDPVPLDALRHQERALLRVDRAAHRRVRLVAPQRLQPAAGRPRAARRPQAFRQRRCAHGQRCAALRAGRRGRQPRRQAQRRHGVHPAHALAGGQRRRPQPDPHRAQRRLRRLHRHLQVAGGGRAQRPARRAQHLHALRSLAPLCVGCSARFDPPLRVHDLRERDRRGNDPAAQHGDADGQGAAAGRRCHQPGLHPQARLHPQRAHRRPLEDRSRDARRRRGAHHARVAGPGLQHRHA